MVILVELGDTLDQPWSPKKNGLEMLLRIL